MNRKIIIIGIVGVVALIIILGYLLLRSGRGNPTGSSGPTPIASALIGNSEAIPVFDGRIYFPDLVENDTAIIGLTDLGRSFTRIDLKSNKTKTLFEDALDFVPAWIKYSPDGKLAIAHQEADSDFPSRTVLFRFDEQTTAELNPNISDLVFSGVDKIIYLYHENDEINRLVEANSDGSDWQVLIEAVPVLNPHLKLSPDGKRLILWRDLFIDADDQSLEENYPLVLVYLEARTTERLPIKGINAVAVWSPDDKKIAYLKSNNGQERLAVFDFTTQEEELTDLATNPNNFDWRSDQDLVAAGQLLNSSDTSYLWQLHLNETPEPLPNLTIEPEIDHLMLADQGKTLFYRRYDFLAKIELDKGGD